MYKLCKKILIFSALTFFGLKTFAMEKDEQKIEINETSDFLTVANEIIQKFSDEKTITTIEIKHVNFLMNLMKKNLFILKQIFNPHQERFDLLENGYISDLNLILDQAADQSTSAKEKFCLFKAFLIEQLETMKLLIGNNLISKANL